MVTASPRKPQPKHAWITSARLRDTEKTRRWPRYGADALKLGGRPPGVE